MLEEKDENKVRDSLCSSYILKSSIKCKELLCWRGAGWSSGLLSVDCSFITLFLIEHSLRLPNNNLISEGAGARAALWHRAAIVPHGESTREAIHGGQTVNHCSTLQRAARVVLRDAPDCSQWIQIALSAPSTGLLELYYMLTAAYFQHLVL